MTTDLIAWWVLAMAAVGCACKMVLSKNPVHSALWLVANLVCLAVLFLILSAPMLFAVQLIVYAGAIMVLFLFVIMFFMSPRARLYLRPPLQSQAVVGGLLAVVVLVMFCVVFLRGGIEPVIFPPPVSVDDAYVAADMEEAAKMGSPRDMGVSLFTNHSLAFELTSVLLLAALLAAMMVARDERSEGRGQVEHFAPLVHSAEPPAGATAEGKAEIDTAPLTEASS
jgi:NADH-quinone oxidoreductase subunit J